jgi:hypothetical protein
MKIDLRGHSRSVEYLEEILKSEIKLFDSTEKTCPGFKKAMYDAPMYPHCECNSCGERLSFKVSDSWETYTSNTECKYKDGFPPIEALLEVPSGEILLFNDLRKFYDKPEERIDVCTTSGVELYTKHYAKQGLIMHFISNTSPDVVQINDERLEIGNFMCEEEEGCELDTCPGPSCKVVNKIGSICSDLWWYCAVDKDTFEKRIGKTVDQFEDDFHATGAWPCVVRAIVTPGTYRTVGQYHIDEDRLFSYIERVK